MGIRPDIVNDIIIQGAIKVFVAEPCITYLKNSGSGLFFKKNPDYEDTSVIECYLVPVRQVNGIL